MNNYSNPYSNFIKHRHITKLVHLTKSSNLPFIFGNESDENGLLTTKSAEQQFGATHIVSQAHLHNYPDYVCCSIERIDKHYYQVQFNKDEKQGDVFNQWVAIFIDPNIINDASLFCQTNAARRSSQIINSGIDAFKSLYNNKVIGSSPDRDQQDNLKPSYPTDYQAEVFIKGKIPKQYLKGVAFPTKSAEVEKRRLKFWNKSIHVFDWESCTGGIEL